MLSVLLLKLPTDWWKELDLSNCNIDNRADDVASLLFYNAKLKMLYKSQ